MLRNLNNKPFRPAACPFFYGWALVGFGTLGMVCSAPGQTIGVATFVDHLIEALGISRDRISLAYMLGTIGSALLLTHAGKAYDRLGARLMATLAGIMLGGVLVLLSRSDRISIWLTGVTGLSGARVAFAVMFLGFFALRFAGQGILDLASRNMILQWFEKHRGLAFGISGVFVSLGFSIMPRVFDAMIDAWTWRGAWQWTGLAIGVGMVVVAAIFFRDNPEDCGLRPDGEPPDVEMHDGPRIHPVRQYTLREARRTYAFWVFTLSLSMFGLFITGLIFHVVSVFEEMGMGKEVAVSIFVPASVASVVVRLAAGWISDHVRLKYLLIFMLLGLAVTMLGFIYLAAGWTRWLIIGGYGTCMAMSSLLLGVVWPRFYGRKHLGAVTGMVSAMMVFSSALGPYLLSKSLVWFGSYRPAAWLCLGAVTVLLIGSVRADNPQQKQPHAPGL